LHLEVEAIDFLLAPLPGEGAGDRLLISVEGFEVGVTGILEFLVSLQMSFSGRVACSGERKARRRWDRLLRTPTPHGRWRRWIACRRGIWLRRSTREVRLSVWHHRPPWKDEG
jgi:hypothetical protein